MRYIQTVVILSFFALSSFAQNGEVKYLNDDGLPCDSALASSYRVMMYPNVEQDSFRAVVYDFTMKGDTTSIIEYGNVKKKMKDGKCIYFQKNGLKKSEEHYKEGKLSGELRSWYPNGQLIRIDTFEDGKSIGGQCFSETGEKVAYFPFRTMPQYPGGLPALGKYLSEHIIYPKKARKRGQEGRVIILFIVDKDGSILNPKVVRGAGKLLDDEAMRVVQTMQKWTPGMEDGKPFKTRYVLPVTFRLTNE